MQGILKKKPEEERWHGTYTDTGRMGSADGGKDTFYVRNELYLELWHSDVVFSALVPQADAAVA